MASQEKRDQIRALVKQVLDSVPSGSEPGRHDPDAAATSLPVKTDSAFDRDESAKSLLTEDDFRGLENGARVRIAETARLTALANDLVRDKQLHLVRKVPRVASFKVETVGVGCDHGGFEMKEHLKECLADQGLRVRDFGTHSKDAVDYPDHAQAVAQAVSSGNIDVGIVIDGAGIGSAMAAGKVPGVRPAACYNVALAKNSREHNGANVLTLGSGQNTLDEAKDIVYAFLTHEITEPRHKKRVGKIDAIERQYRQ
ncbi:MAG: RpiB/LacA/LacB family sugar-phosphate isomerase [Pyrinomonadaceae bacterium]|nr:RpiB/LacA/LacB family sugar-phosphate isomerase [Pyrinomonadaceae bacterium]